MNGQRQRRRCPHWLVDGLGALALLAAACSTTSTTQATTTVTYVGVAGGHISFGTTESPTGCNPHTPIGDTPGTRLVLGAVLPSPFVVGASGTPPPPPTSELTESAEPVSLNPQTIVYTLNPKAVWSDGVPISATDFKYAWEQQRGDPNVPADEVSSIAGYRDIASVTGSNGGQTVTVKFKTPFADWKSLFDNLLPAHVMEKVGWSPSCATVNPLVDLSGGPFKIGSVGTDRITLVQNPKWWGTPANAASITVHVASSTTQLTRWMSTGFVQVALPQNVTPDFLMSVTSLPNVESEVDTSANLLQLDMASSPGSTLPLDVRAAVALTINRQGLVNRQASWAVPGLQVADSHVFVQGQPNYKPAPPTVPTTTVPPQTSSTSTTLVGAGGSVNFPTTPVPTQAAAFIEDTGLVRTTGNPYYHSAFGTPFQLHLAYDDTDPWAVAAAPVIQDELRDAGLDTSIYPVDGAQKTGLSLYDGYTDMALLASGFTPYLSQTQAWYTSSLGPPGVYGSENWTGYDDDQFNHLVQTASQQLNPDTAAADYSQADTRLWDDMVSLPSLCRANHNRLEPVDWRGDADSYERQSPVVRAAVGCPQGGDHEQHHPVAAGAVGRTPMSSPKVIGATRSPTGLLGHADIRIG